ncbi:MAG: outer membrane beta-barrel protein [Saprospiraceae bacterium]|nr:outer membrane beta-barrel protein [Saprospiraceae bacterium]
MLINSRPIRPLIYSCLILVGLLGTSSLTFAQTFSIKGVLQSSTDGSTLPAATIVLLNPDDSTIVAGAVTDFEGVFKVTDLKPGKLILRGQYVGYRTLSQEVEIKEVDLDLGTLVLEEEPTVLKQVIVESRRATGVQNGDTTEFNAAAFKTMRDASAQALVEKLPGINLENGTLQAQGENVVQVLVDGKEFFGQDVKAALQNLPAEIVQSVQIYDRKSDKAELSGFDDGEEEKTINIVTKADRRRGKFGRTSFGYGSDGRYLAGASVNFFDNNRRVTLTGLSNNINTLDYSADANSQGETRNQNGIITTNTLGINFSDEWGKKIEISGSYQYSQGENEINSTRIRDYILPSSEEQLYRESNANTQNNEDHRFSMRFDYNINDRNRLVIRPNISVRSDQENSFFFGRTTVGDDPLNQSENTRNDDNQDFSFNNRMYFSHKFLKKGRTFTLGLTTGYGSNQDVANRLAVNDFFGTETRQEILDQYITRDRTSFSWETNFSYTEPVGKKGQIELEYEVGNNLNDSDQITYDVLEDPDPNEVVLLPDTALSNTFTSEYLSQEIELGYQYKLDKFRIQVEAEYRQSDLQNDQAFPQPFFLERTFRNLAPTVRIDFQFTKTSRLDLDYDTRINVPSINQLQDVFDITNPLRLSTGNPDLAQAFTHRIRGRYRSRNRKTDRSIFAFMQASITDNFITNSSIIAEETTELEEGIILERGSQFFFPVNVDGYWDLRSYFSYSMPAGFIKSNINFNSSINFSHRPGVVNDEVNFVDNTSFRLGFRLSSNISDQIDFNFSTRSSYNLVDNSLRPTLNNNFFSQSTRFSTDWVVWKDLVYRLDLNHRFNGGLSDDLERSFLLLNMSIGTKIFRNKRGELSLQVYDLLQQNNSINRNVTELFIEDVQSNVLQRYFMLTFSYNIRQFSGGASMDDFRKNREDDRRGRRRRGNW